MALRNLKANAKRSVVTVVLSTASTALLVFATALWDGSHNKMIQNAVEIYPGYLQVTQKDFRENPSYDNLIFDTGAVSEILEKISGIRTFAPRFESFVLFSSGDRAVGAMLTGIVPDKEQYLSRLASSLKKGSYLDKNDTNDLYIGSELAKRLHVDVGDELSFVGNGADYSFSADNLIIKGIFTTGLFEFDSSSSFLNKPYFDEIMASTNMATHFIILPSEPEKIRALTESIQQRLGSEYRAESWLDTMSGLVEAMEVDSIFGYITLGIIFIVIFFVIMIYTLLSVYARIKEIGILRAIGTSPNQILAMLVSESVILAFLSVVLGGLIGGCFAYYFHLHPILLSSFEEQFRQYGLAPSSMPTEFNPVRILRDTLIMFCLCVLSTLYPIFKVNRFRPVEAIQHV